MRKRFGKRRPFEPFELRLPDGEIYQVRHPENMTLGKNRIVLADPETDRIAVVALIHVNASKPCKQPDTWKVMLCMAYEKDFLLVVLCLYIESVNAEHAASAAAADIWSAVTCHSFSPRQSRFRLQNGAGSKCGGTRKWESGDKSPQSRALTLARTTWTPATCVWLIRPRPSCDRGSRRRRSRPGTCRVFPPPRRVTSLADRITRRHPDRSGSLAVPSSP